MEPNKKVGVREDVTPMMTLRFLAVIFTGYALIAPGAHLFEFPGNFACRRIVIRRAEYLPRLVGGGSYPAGRFGRRYSACADLD
jgi:hypothetical protein